MVYNYQHEESTSASDADLHSTSTYFSVINNIIITNSEHSGLSVIGQGSVDRGETASYNWVHNFSHIFVSNCQKYGIVAQGSDNLWSEINVSHCGLTNVYCFGWCEMWNNLKLDGESGFNVNASGDKTSQQILKGYDGALLTLRNVNNSCFVNLDLQSCLYSGIKIFGAQNVNIIGSINNIGLAYKELDDDGYGNGQKYTPAIYCDDNCYSNYLNFNVFQHLESSGLSTKYPFSYRKEYPESLFTSNTVVLNYKSFTSYENSLTDLKSFSLISENVCICPNIGRPLTLNKEYHYPNDKQIMSSIYDNVEILYFDNNLPFFSKIYNWENLQNEGKTAEAIAITEAGKTIYVSVNADTTGRYLNPSAERSENVCLINYGDAAKDYKGDVNTQIALRTLGFAQAGTTFDYCINYSSANITAGQWYAPSLGEMIILYKYKDAVELALSLINGANELTDYIYKTSTQHNDQGLFYVFDIRTGKISTESCTTKSIVRAFGTLKKQNSFTPFGDTSGRPSPQYNIELQKGLQYFDTTLGKPIYWNGTAWVDATGTPV